MQPEQELKQVRQVVEQCLKEDDRCTYDDTWLTIMGLRKLGIKIFIDYSQLKTMPKFETFKRIRADFQNRLGKYLPTDPKVREERMKKSEALRRFFATVKGDCI